MNLSTRLTRAGLAFLTFGMIAASLPAQSGLLAASYNGNGGNNGCSPKNLSGDRNEAQEFFRFHKGKGCGKGHNDGGNQGGGEGQNGGFQRDPSARQAAVKPAARSAAARPAAKSAAARTALRLKAR